MADSCLVHLESLYRLLVAGTSEAVVGAAIHACAELNNAAAKYASSGNSWADIAKVTLPCFVPSRACVRACMRACFG